MTARIDLLQQWVLSQLQTIEPNFVATIEHLRKHWSVVSGDASFRRYFRVNSGRRTYIVMDAPPQQESLDAFIEAAGRIRQAGLRAPLVYAEHRSEGFLLLEDFGDELLKSALDHVDADKDLGQRLFDQVLPLLKGMAEACSTSPFTPTIADLPYPSTLSPPPAASRTISVSISPRPGARHRNSVPPRRT